ncbi:MAG: WD40-like Beta Propeller Repeat protein [Candidatus Hydrogenedentes bacterium ADurb.Bin179]|nr:MAG: WD40-like Beta Propeller Repeat protein [Candidatus Hydrogenedentes bacterium ADurb.Bin179]
MNKFTVISLVMVGALVYGTYAKAQEMTIEKQLTFACQSHWLDNNDNFSADGRYLCYDTRETVGLGIDNGQTIEVLELETGRSIIVYKPDRTMVGETPAPGVGAVSFNLASNEMAFIHGPLVEEVPLRGAYGKPNRNGACVRLDGTVVESGGVLHMLKEGRYAFSWLDCRDVATDRATLPGAHRGGTHRHEYCVTGTRIGFTYDDFLLPQYDRTIGYMEPHAKAPKPASHYFAVLVPVKPKDTSKPGELEKAYGDSWVDAAGTMRAFIGKVRNPDGITYEESLFVVDIPLNVDITSADSGNASRYPAPPADIKVRRLTHDWAGGIVRGAPDGKRIAYYGKDKQGRMQIFIIDAMGSDRADEPALHPKQATFLEEGTEAGLRWFPSGDAILCVSDNGLVVTSVQEGDTFGKSVFLTPKGDGRDRHAPVISPDGKRIAYNCPVETKDKDGQVCKNYAGLDFIQILMLELPQSPVEMFQSL